MRQGRGSWYLFTGVIIGFALGLVYVWVLHPVPRRNVNPATLSQEDKDHYRALIAFSFLSNRDLVRARARLETLGEPDMSQSLMDQAQHRLAQGGADGEVNALLTLLEALNRESDASPPSTPGS